MCVASTFLRVLNTVILVNNKTDVNNFDGKALFKMFLSS